MTRSLIVLAVVIVGLAMAVEHRFVYALCNSYNSDSYFASCSCPNSGPNANACHSNGSGISIDHFWFNAAQCQVTATAFWHCDISDFPTSAKFDYPGGSLIKKCGDGTEDCTGVSWDCTGKVITDPGFGCPAGYGIEIKLNAACGGCANGQTVRQEDIDCDDVTS